ncbi:MAG: hypothetical protein A2Z88_11105 [Omnitrophica WOR_2 bacterium GWA2_47_8]|nr:MAG: hypothetical protein A2Z88_11105 [Omnitrophica WOR_2 bacterium GWA2_47_8]
MEQRALGKGLSALIPEKAEVKAGEKVAEINIRSIKFNSQQPRKNYDDEKLQELISSIKEKGVLQPILVRPKGENYEVIAGERRLRAALALNLEKVPVVIRPASDQEALVLALIENIQREELNPIEEAQAFRKLIEEFSYTQESVAQSVGKDRSTITNLLRLLKLPQGIQDSIAKGIISEGHGRALLGVESEPLQKEIFDHIVAKGISVRELETIIRSGLKTPKSSKAKSASKDGHINSLEELLQKILGTKVRIVHQKKRGNIVIEYYSDADLERIVRIFQK